MATQCSWVYSNCAVTQTLFLLVAVLSLYPNKASKMNYVVGKIARYTIKYTVGIDPVEVAEAAGSAIASAVNYVALGISSLSGESPLSDVLIYTGIAKEFRGVKFSEWTRALDDHMAVACYEVVEALNRKRARSVGSLTWDNVLKVFRNCHHITRDDGCSKRIQDRLSWDETNYFKFDGSPDPLRKREFITWLKTLMNERGEQDVFDNSRLITEETLDRLASCASQSGATVKGPVTLVHASENDRDTVMEIAVIRFPTKHNSKIKIYRLKIDSWFQCSRTLFVQHDETGLEIEYETFSFKPNTHVIDDRFATRARTNLSNPEMFRF